MFKTIRIGAAGIAMFAALGMGTAAHADTASADATAEVLAALTLTNTAGLNFGTVVLNTASTGGTVVVDTTGSRTCGGDVICGPGGAEQAAGFNVTGAPGSNVAIIVQDLATTPVSLTHTGNVGSTNAEHNIELTALVDSTGGGGPGFTGDVDFTVGGTIALDGSEIAGVYEGTFDVTAEYQ
jgi:hypothetical protein